ncbi:hypothetical protein H4R35_000429 [Dimargaris xerosporica]|nr:hypothetical protein H4R35_000429 [Dimargaris xerosporica]
MTLHPEPDPVGGVLEQLRKTQRAPLSRPGPRALHPPSHGPQSPLSWASATGQGSVTSGLGSWVSVASSGVISLEASEAESEAEGHTHKPGVRGAHRRRSGRGGIAQSSLKQPLGSMPPSGTRLLSERQSSSVGPYDSEVQQSQRAEAELRATLSTILPAHTQRPHGSTVYHREHGNPLASGAPWTQSEVGRGAVPLSQHTPPCSVIEPLPPNHLAAHSDVALTPRSREPGGEFARSPAMPDVAMGMEIRSRSPRGMTRLECAASPALVSSSSNRTARPQAPTTTVGPTFYCDAAVLLFSRRPEACLYMNRPKSLTPPYDYWATMADRAPHLHQTASSRPVDPSLAGYQQSTPPSAFLGNLLTMTTASPCTLASGDYNTSVLVTPQPSPTFSHPPGSTTAPVRQGGGEAAEVGPPPPRASVACSPAPPEGLPFMPEGPAFPLTYSPSLSHLSLSLNSSCGSLLVASTSAGPNSGACSPATLRFNGQLRPAKSKSPSKTRARTRKRTSLKSRRARSLHPLWTALLVCASFCLGVGTGLWWATRLAAADKPTWTRRIKNFCLELIA